MLLKVTEAQLPAGAFHGTVGNMFSENVIRLQVSCLVRGKGKLEPKLFCIVLFFYVIYSEGDQLTF